MSSDRGRRTMALRKEEARRREFIAQNVGWGETPDRRLVSDQEMPLPLALVSPWADGAEIRLRVRCKECGSVLGLVFDWSTADGKVSGRKLVINGGHALLAGDALVHRFVFECCSWTASRVGAELAKKSGTMQLP